ncbi:hypothetical protein BGW39_003179 [Mortierella sp. 14UC]|nr:hypothetical protein BGW39_003179 [Mortierella sp. 14UC]
MKALLSLQARRVNKPDAKVLRLPEIQTSSTTSSTATTTPIAGLLGHVLRGDGGQLGAAGSSSEDGGALSGLETSMATAVLLDTVRTSSTTTTLPLLSCDTQEFLSTEAAAPASATIDSLQDATDYQLRVSESGRVVVDSILTELTTSVKSEEDIMVKGDGNDSSTDTADIDNRPKDFNFPGHGNSDIRGQEQETNSSKFTTTTIAATVSGSTPKVAPEASSETNLPTALENAFKFIESGPVVIDAAEIKRFVKRSHALQELESTEQSYVDDLDVLVHVHLRILESKSWFPHNVHLNMHRCVMGLLALHRDFLSQIQVYKTTSESDYEKRAPLQAYRTLEVAFLGLSQDHKLYSQFCELRMRTVNEINRTVGQSTLSVLQKESKELMAQQGRPKSRTDLKDHLIKPIQRICRYPLLLKEILRLTSPNDPEYEFIDRAHECMKTLAQQMDETQRMVERKLLTEQFLKKLPETNFPRKSGVALTPLHTSSKSNPDSNNHHRRGSNNAIHPLSSRSIGPTSELELFESGQFGEGILPRNMTKIYARTLGSIVLAGALEYVIMPDMPIRLRYYGCFLFESMLIVVKAKKTSLYEPRQWLPLRLCELYETTSLDGYTRYGWRITYGQFRIDFGASCETERQAWMSALQTHIQAAKLAHARLPCDTSTLEAVVSSLPWNMARPPSPPISTLFSGATESMLMIESTSGAGAGLGLSRQVQVYQQPPSPTPSPWSTCSSAIPSPLMPPPPMATCSTSSTMMMAMSFMTNTGEPEKWNDRGTPGVSLDAYAQYYEQHIHPHAHEAMSAHAEANDPSRLGLTRHLSVESGCDDSPRGYGMAGTRTGNSSTSATTTGESCQQHDQGYNSLNRSHSQSRTRPANESNPLSARKSESAVSGSNGGHLLFPSTPSPWLVPDPRPRSHSFDVARVFASSHSGGIKPNQRNLVQSMFKDVSTENIWTTTTLATTANNNHHNLHSQPSPQLIPSASSSSPMSSRAGRYSTPLPFSYFNNNNPSTSTSNFGGSITLPPPTSPKVTAGMVSISGSSHGHSGSSTSGNNVGGEDDETPVSTLTLQSAGSSCSSLTSRLLRRRDSLTGTKGSPNGPSVLPSSCSSEKNEWDRRRSSATAAIVAATSALNFRKNSEPSPNTSTSNTQNQHHRRRLSIPDPVALLFNSNGYTDPAGGHAHPAQDGIYQKSSIKARAQLIEKQAAHGLTALFASAPSLAPPGRNNPKKGGSGFGSGKLKSSLSGQDLASSFTATSSSSASLASMSMNAGESLATGSLMTEADVDCEILNSLSNAAAEAARSRRGGAGGAGNSERVQRRSIGATLAMTSINDPANTTALSSSASSSVTGAAAAFSQGLRPSTSTHSLPVYFGSNSSSTHSLVYSSHATESHPRDTVEKIWMAMGRLTHKRNAEDRYGSSSSGKSQHSQQKQQMYTHGSNQSSGSFVGGTGGKVTSSPRSLRRSSTHVSNNPSPTVPSPGGTSLLATEASSRPSSMHMDDARTSTSNSSSGSRNHHRTVSESTVKSIDSATSLMSDGSIPHHQQVILGNMVSSSPSSVPRLALTPSGSVRSRSSSNSSVHSSLLSIHDQSNSLSHINDPQYHRHYRGNKQQEYDARQPLLPCSSTDHHRHGESGISGGMAIVTSSPCSSLRHSGSGSRNSISSSSASSLSPALHYHHQDSTHYQLQPSAFQDRTKALMTPSAVILPSAFQKGHHYPSATPHFDSASIQDRSKSLSILQNFSQASQKFRTMIRSPTAARIGRSRRGTVTNLSPITMDHGATPSGSQVQAVEEDESEVVGGGGVHGGDIDVEPLVSEKDMEENFGSEQQQQQQQQQRGVPDFTTITV